MTLPALLRLIARMDTAVAAPPPELPFQVTATLAESVADPAERYSILAIACGVNRIPG